MHSNTFNWDSVVVSVSHGVSIECVEGESPNILVLDLNPRSSLPANLFL